MKIKLKFAKWYADHHYHLFVLQVVGQALISTLSAGLGAEFTPDVQEAWTTFYQIISNKMKEGLNEANQEKEAWTAYHLPW